MTFSSALLVIAAFALGFCMARVSLCAVATVRALVVRRQVSGVAALLVAASGSGILLLSVALWRGDAFSLAMGPAPNRQLLWGGVLLGLGALLNGGCYLGSVSYVGTGNYHYLLTLAGFVLAARFAAATTATTVAATAPYLPRVVGLAIFVVVALGAWHRWRPTPASARLFSWRSTWAWPLAALACGVCAALVNLLRAGWSYSRLLEALATGNLSLLNWSVVLSACAIFAGAIGSSMLAGNFHRPEFSALKALRCLGGGLLMGYAAAHIPGGNDSLLLWAIPGLALYGLIAYLTMLATIFCALACAPLGVRLFSHASAHVS